MGNVACARDPVQRAHGQRRPLQARGRAWRPSCADLHGGAAPQVRKRAAERLIMSADHVSQKLLEWLDDPEVPYRVRAEIAQDLLDRAGLIATQVHQIIPTTEDPIMRFFEDAFSDPNNWEENPPQPAIEERVIDRPDPGEPEEIDRTVAGSGRPTRFLARSTRSCALTVP